MPNSVMGEMVHAAVVLCLTPLTPVNPQDIVTWCHSQLALYKCPTTVHVVEELPTTGSGKVLKKVLRATFSHGSGATALAVASPAVTAVPAGEMASSATQIQAVASAAAQAAVSAVAPRLDHSASDAHTPAKAASSKDGSQISCHELLDAVAAHFPDACMLDTAASGVVMDPAKCHLSVVDDWTAAVTQVSIIQHHHHLHCQSCIAIINVCCICSRPTACAAACSWSVACKIWPKCAIS